MGRWVSDVEENLYPKMDSSGMVMSLVPDGKPDAKFCVELGMAIMLDKPIISVVMPGRVIPERLKRVSDRIVTGDMKTKAGREELSRKLAEAMERIGDGEE